jgi:hypothetical protein
MGLVGGLSEPSKMPCYGYSIPPSKCKTGAKLRKVKNSVCSICYAFRGHYQYQVVKLAQARRFASLTNPLWVKAMAFLINTLDSSGYFRWHDAGDLQSVKHFKRIVKVCELTPNTRHWLPTREYGMVRKYIEKGGKIPSNLCVRLSAYMIDGEPPTALARKLGVSTSGVSKESFTCPASSQGNKCLLCRACWEPKHENVSYKRH